MEKNIIIITGGTSGLGLELVKQCIDRELYVCNLARNKEKMNELSNLFNEDYKGFIGDISDEEFVTNSIKEISKLGNIKYLINNAEKACFKSPSQYTKSDIDLSLTGLKGNKQEALYCATKWGERGYTESYM